MVKESAMEINIIIHTTVAEFEAVMEQHKISPEAPASVVFDDDDYIEIIVKRVTEHFDY